MAMLAKCYIREVADGKTTMFKLNGTITDIPVKDTEKPQLEKQVDLFQWQQDQANLESLVTVKNK